MMIIQYLCIGVTSYFLLDLFLKFLGSVIVKLRVEGSLYRKRMNHKIDYEYFRPVSLVIPILESNKFEDCLKKVVELDYNQFEVILVAETKEKEKFMDFIEKNDFMKVSKPFKKQVETEPIDRMYEGQIDGISITLVFKERTILADDYNAGVNIARFPYILTLKSNMQISKNALKEFVRTALTEENVVMCSGVIQGDAKKKNLFTFLETIHSILQFTKKTCFDLWNGNLFFRSDFAFFKKDVFFETKGFSLKNGETDSCFCGRFHVYLKKRKRKYKIHYVMTANATEELELNFKKYVNLRKEEILSFLFGLLHNKKLFLKPKYGFLSLFTYTYSILFEFMKPLLFLLEVGLLLYLILVHSFSYFAVLLGASCYILLTVLNLWLMAGCRKKILMEKEAETVHIVID